LIRFAWSPLYLSSITGPTFYLWFVLGGGSFGDDSRNARHASAEMAMKYDSGSDALEEEGSKGLLSDFHQARIVTFIPPATPVIMVLSGTGSPSYESVDYHIKLKIKPRFPVEIPGAALLL
jgi:hypothetical protein